MRLYSKTFSELLADNRHILMGLSMICIMLYHAPWFQGNSFFQWMNMLGYLGVEVFFLISGFGIAHSLRKNSLRVFYKNRVVRLLPVCFVAGMLKIILSYIPGMPGTSPCFIWDLLGIANWYVYAIIVYYILSPIIFKSVNKWGWYFFLGIIVLSYGIVYFWKEDSDAYFLIYFGRWIVKRLPVYVLGLLLAQKPLKVKPIVYCTAGIFFFMLNLLALHYIIAANANPDITSIPARWFTYIPNSKDIPDNGRYLLDMLSVFFLCPAFAAFGFVLDKVKTKQFVSWFGIYSLELYVTHHYIFVAFHGNCTMPDIIVFPIALVTSVVVAYCLRWMALPVSKVINKI